MTNPALEFFGSRLKRARMAQRERGNDALSQGALAVRIGVKALAVGRWENDEREPALATVRRLAAELGVTAGWLVNGEGGEPEFIRRANAFLPPPRYEVTGLQGREDDEEPIIPKGQPDKTLRSVKKKPAVDNSRKKKRA